MFWFWPLVKNLEKIMILKNLCGRTLMLTFVSVFAFASCSVAQEAEEDSPSSTLGMAAPEDAVVLFDGTNFDAWKPFSFGAVNPHNTQEEIQWNLVDGDAMEIAFLFEGKRRKQFLVTKRWFGDYRLHLEFKLPEDGGKCNSGLFFGPLYEMQILNSGNKKKAGLTDAGAIYNIRAPDENAVLPPGEWQTVDLEYRAARFEPDGSRTENNCARVTIHLNGTLIHDNFKLSLRRNKYGAFPELPTSPIVLQDHDSRVQFKNIWVVDRNPKKELED